MDYYFSTELLEDHEYYLSLFTPQMYSTQTSHIASMDANMNALYMANQQVFVPRPQSSLLTSHSQEEEQHLKEINRTFPIENRAELSVMPQQHQTTYLLRTFITNTEQEIIVISDDEDEPATTQAQPAAVEQAELMIPMIPNGEQEIIVISDDKDEPATT